MKVRMVARITGLRNGVEWPAPGEEMDLPDNEAETMLEVGAVELVKVAKAEKPEPEKRPAARKAETRKS